MTNNKLVDPVEEQTFESELEEMEQAVDIDGLELSDFTVPQQKYTRGVHPFDGYPQQEREITTGHVVKTHHDSGPHKGKEIKTGPVKTAVKQTVNATHLVAMNPTVTIHQDPSGKGHQLSNGKIVNLRTTHNRVVVDTESRRNIDVVFDRQLLLANGKTMDYALVPNHGARAQLIFYWDAQKEKVEVNTMYMLLDKGQMARLRKTFDQWNHQQMKTERLASQFDEAEESTAADRG